MGHLNGPILTSVAAQPAIAACARSHYDIMSPMLTGWPTGCVYTDSVVLDVKVRAMFTDGRVRRRDRGEAVLTVDRLNRMGLGRLKSGWRWSVADAFKAALGKRR